VQPDGKILAAGRFGNNTGQKIALVRYNSDGSLDTSFNDTGIVVTAIGENSGASGMALQPDGRIVLAGMSDYDFLVARYYGNGALEGSVTTDFATELGNPGDEAHAVALQSDGKILVAGRAGVLAGQAENTFAVARYLPGDPAVPYAEIAVEQPAGVNFLSGSATPQDMGTVLSGSSSNLTFTIRNQGNANLTGLAVAKAATGTPGDFTIGPLKATVAPGGTTTFTVTFSPSGAGIRTATLEIASNDANENPFVINLTAKQATASETWRQQYFGSPYNTGAGADLNDPDSDGIVNLLEWATYSHPLEFSPPPGQLVKNGSTLEFTYTRPKAALDEITYVLEWTESLSSEWRGIGVVTVLSDDGTLQQVRHSVSEGAVGKRFVRLRVRRM